LRNSDKNVQLFFIQHWPAIRDNHETKKWLPEIVSALVIVRIGDVSAQRVACVHMELKDWIAANPQPGMVELI
jgi:hypothetical protein